MKAIAKYGLAAALLLGGSSLTLAQDADAGVDVGAGVEAGADAGMDAGADAGMDAEATVDAGADNVGVDATTTGSVNANYGSLISSMQSGSAPDLTTFSDTASVDCVAVSGLQGNADAQALDNAISQNQADIDTLHTDIEANSALMTRLETSCASIADFSVDKVISVESGADGSWTFYVDDRA